MLSRSTPGPSQLHAWHKIDNIFQPTSINLMSQPIDWEHQRAFLAVLREGSLSAAARALGLAQPTIRRRIEDLEAAHGVVLFTRSPTGLLPTAIALDLQTHALTMARAAEAFGRTASAEAGAAAGVVRISASEVMGVEVLPRLLAPLRARHPGLVIEMDLSNAQADLLRHEADVALRMVCPAQGALVAKAVGRISYGLHAHSSYIARHGVPQTLADLKGHALIGFQTETATIAALRAQGLTLQPGDFAYRTDSDLGQLAAIRAGIGIGVCQTAIARRDPDLVPVLADDFRLGQETWVVTHENLRHVRRVSLVFDALVAGLAG